MNKKKDLSNFYCKMFRFSFLDKYKNNIGRHFVHTGRVVMLALVV